MINLFIKYLIGKPRIKNFKSKRSNNIYKKIYIEMMPYFY